ncbi:TolC family outer membrane protein [Shimia thalassica]|uniref:TolC family outer membrane protein n=1 Tax=Shimia thalassica TaxID=1715693 RepID=UPI000C0891D2|nr:TolC family outer membrane protein [Shimia thalassica]MBU2943080.1 TolC family outer membrane protein [Shimia thalassica]MDO6502597.1 TolC family outer membrane protein [Shimia thalassica]PHO02885.1 transporter [Rhodobacteraceae bacterium 4F10]
MARGILNSVKAGFFAVSAAVIVPVASHAETLADALASAYTHSGLLQQNRALLRAADEDVAATYALLRPVLNWSSTVTQDFGTYSSSSTSGLDVSLDSTEAFFGLGFELLLYDNGATRFAVDAAKETVLSTRQTLVNVEQAILFEAVQGFMDVVRDAQIVQLQQNNLRLVARELQAAKDRFEVGEVTRTDVALAEARLAGGRADLAVAQGNLMQARERFAAATGHQPGALVAPSVAPKTPASLDDAKAVAIRSHPLMIKAQHDITTAEIGVMRARALMGPSVKLQGSYGLTEDFSDPYSTHAGSVGISATGIIYQGGRQSALYRQAMANRDATRAGLHDTRHAIRQQAGNAWAILSAATAQLAASGEQIEASQIAFDGIREEAKLGSRTTLDVLIAEQDLLDAKSSRITAQAAQYSAAYGVLSSMGLLTADHLNLNVEKYDPVAYYNLVEDAPTISSKRGKQLDKVLRAIGKE